MPREPLGAGTPPELREAYDVAVVGTGPAGMAAASLIARHGISTVTFDEQPGPGGQAYRAITTTPLTDRRVLGDDYWKGEALAKELLASGAHHVPNAVVTAVTRDLDVHVRLGHESRVVRAKRVILATGATERPFPIAGSTLAGVATAGAAQAELKRSGRVPEGGVVLAGTGPLLWVVARQYLEAGANVAAILDTTPRENLLRALPSLAGFAFSPYLGKAVALSRAVRRRVKVLRDLADLRAEGDDRVRAIAWRSASGSAGTLPVDVLLLHQGVGPNVGLAKDAGVDHRWDAEQLCWAPLLDRDGGTSVAGLHVAGDAAGIAGAQVAAWRGVFIACSVVRSLKPGTAVPSQKLAQAALARFMRGRRFLDRLYKPSGRFNTG
jgi:NADPH-dependent 2,4-dienoyl-CoA reductase/sulfur reductase-like enzyme